MTHSVSELLVQHLFADARPSRTHFLFALAVNDVPGSVCSIIVDLGGKTMQKSPNPLMVDM